MKKSDIETLLKQVKGRITAHKLNTDPGWVIAELESIRDQLQALVDNDHRGKNVTTHPPGQATGQ